MIVVAGGGSCCCSKTAYCRRLGLERRGIEHAVVSHTGTYIPRGRRIPVRFRFDRSSVTASTSQNDNSDVQDTFLMCLLSRQLRCCRGCLGKVSADLFIYASQNSNQRQINYYFIPKITDVCLDSLELLENVIVVRFLKHGVKISIRRQPTS